VKDTRGVEKTYSHGRRSFCRRIVATSSRPILRWVAAVAVELNSFASWQAERQVERRERTTTLRRPTTLCPPFWTFVKSARPGTVNALLTPSSFSTHQLRGRADRPHPLLPLASCRSPLLRRCFGITVLSRYCSVLCWLSI